jgi:hypothetical protein
MKEPIRVDPKPAQNSLLTGEELQDGNEGTLLESEPASLPKMSPKEGYKTSQGHFTALFILASLIMSLWGYHKSPEQIETYVQLIDTLLKTVLPLLMNVPVLNNYVNSRGKIQSNSLWASAEIAKAQAQGTGIPLTIGGLTEEQIREAFGNLRRDIEELNKLKGPTIPDIMMGSEVPTRPREFMDPGFNRKGQP